MQNRSDTHGEGLDPKALKAALLEGCVWSVRDERTNKERIEAAIRAYLSVIASDTAGPSDHAGLVAELRSHADTQIDDNLAYIKKADELMHRAAEAIAALSRAPEVVAVKPLEWLDHPGDGSILRQGSTGRTYRFRALHAFGAYFILDDADGDFFLYESGEQHSDFMFPTLESAQAAAQADYERRIKSALVGGENDPR